MQAIVIGIAASLFFASTFVLNRSMDLAGGSWIWSAALRYLFTVPFLLLLVLSRNNLQALIAEMRARPDAWLLWSTVGFGLFYAPLCFAAAYGPAWLVAGTWQITIVAGCLLVPVFFQKAVPQGAGRLGLPLRELATSLFILLGVVLIQLQAARHTALGDLAAGFFPVLIAAFAYPLGNRKMMAVCQGKLDVYQRVLGMTLASMPFWLLLSAYGTVTVGLPDWNQIVQSLLVAVCSGIIATVLFFYATDLTNGDAKKLAAVEATQAGEVVFAILGEVVFLAAPMPSGYSLAGIAVIIAGMVAHSINSHKQ